MTRAELRALAEATDFRPDTLEKVVRLVGILSRLESHELCRGNWLLKGGTAINLFYLDVPRLSVDIDLNFVGTENVAELAEARRLFESALAACCAREGCSVKRAPEEHAGGKFRLRYASVLGSEQNLEVDVSYVARVPLFGVKRRPCALPVESSAIPMLTLEELAAGKFVALLSRGAARDFFDVFSLLKLAPDLPTNNHFRISVVCQAGASRSDLRKLKALPKLHTRDIERQVIPLLRAGSAASSDADKLVLRLNEEVQQAVGKVVAWSEGELRFLDRFLEYGEIEPGHLTEDETLQARIRKQPMLLWKQQNVRRRRGPASR